MLSGGIPPAVQTVAPSAQTATLIPGQTYSGVIRLQGDTLFAQIGGTQLPLADGLPLAAGQRISVYVTSAGNALQLEISPLPAPAAAATSPPDLGSVLRPILQVLGKLDLAPRAASVLPQQLPATPASLHPLFTALFSARQQGRDLQQLQHLLSGVSGLGTLAPDTASAVVRWLEQVFGGSGQRAPWQQLLAQGRAERNAAARIARSLQFHGRGVGLAGARDSAASLVQRLLADPAFMTWLREAGQTDSFDALAARIRERATGGDLLNTRALDQSYQFLELPVHKQSGLLRAHVHSFSEDGGAKSDRKQKVYRTVLDLETTRLGSVWIAIQAAGEVCACHFRLAEPEAVARLEAEAPALERALEALGYRTTIAAESWDGDRETAVIDLLAPFQKLDLEG